MKTIIRTDIEEAAVAYAQSECSDKIPAFRAGAAYIMSLPLADRLTSEEKEKIRLFHNILSKDVRIFSKTQLGILSKKHLEKLEQIFGTAMFEEKGESNG